MTVAAGGHHPDKRDDPIFSIGGSVVDDRVTAELYVDSERRRLVWLFDIRTAGRLRNVSRNGPASP
jgi:hypothetical protein